MTRCDLGALTAHERVLAPLSPREAEIVSLVAHGHTNAQIYAELFV